MIKKPTYWKITFCFYLIALLISVSGCFSDRDEIVPELPGDTLDGNGLTKDIRDLVPEYIINEMMNQGMPLYGGANPPNLNGEYVVEPLILIGSNRPSDVLGTVFPDFFVTFSDQDNDQLMVMVDYINGPEVGTGLGSFLVGEGSRFSIFVKLDIEHSGGTRAVAIYVISGDLTDDGIRGTHLANFMVDDMGDVGGVWIENGEGRVFYDEDGFSPKTGSTPKWYSGLPDCPCEYSTALDNTVDLGGIWIDCGAADQDYHFGASFEIRWVPNIAGQPGQQCTYDSSRKLITEGIAAGSPDKDSPDICGWGDILSGNGFPDYDHYCDDVAPWLAEDSNLCWGDMRVSCVEYLNAWPTNNGNGCSQNIVTGINHMLPMIGDMSCQEITEIFTTILSSQSATAELRNYLTGNLNYTPDNLKPDLIQVFDGLDCSNNLDELNCSALNEAISNL